MRALNTNYKSVGIHRYQYWAMKEQSGIQNSMDFDSDCGLKYQRACAENLLYMFFSIIDKKKFDYACIKYEFKLEFI